VRGTKRRCSLLSLHTFQSLVPICSSKQRGVLGPVTIVLCPSWLFSFWCRIPLPSAELGAQEPQPAFCLWRRYLSLAWTCVPVPLCQLSSLVLPCVFWKRSTLLQPGWTKCMDGKEGPGAPSYLDEIYGITQLPFEKVDVEIKGLK